MGSDIVPAEAEHVFVLARNMRLQDVAEVEACGYTPLAMLERCVGSAPGFAVRFDGVAVALFGVRPVDDGAVLGARARGEVWFLTGEGFERKPVTALKMARQVVSVMLQTYEELLNVIDGRYTQALRFAQSLGAVFHSPVMIGTHPFIPFTIRRR